MAANTVETQIIYDDAKTTVVKIMGYYTAATNSNGVVLQANTLMFANNNKPCVVSLTGYQYTSDFNDGYALLQWVSAANGNNDIAVIGGQSAGVMGAYMQNPIAQANTANLNGGSGDIGLTINGAKTLDSFTLILNLNKEGDAQGGFANAFIAYNDPSFMQPPVLPI